MIFALNFEIPLFPYAVVGPGVEPRNFEKEGSEPFNIDNAFDLCHAAFTLKNKYSANLLLSLFTTEFKVLSAT